MISIPNLLESSKSRLCIGIDPRVPYEDRVRYAKQLINETAEYAIAYKPNIQFWHGVSSDKMKEVTSLIHDYGLPAIADLKISDIGSTNEHALKMMYEHGFDYVTHSPFPGNTKETNAYAKEIGIGIITLVAMSNPTAEWMIQTKMFESWATESGRYSDGIVVGATNHITENVIETIASRLTTQFVLAPGIGKQGGQTGLLERYFGDTVIYNVSRGIGLSDDFQEAAKYYHDLITQD